MRELLTNRFTIALLVPLLLVIAGGFGKKLVRGPGWHRKDFYLGVEATLAALSSGFIRILEIGSSALTPNDQNGVQLQDVKDLIATGVFLVVAFCMFLFILSLHQNLEQDVEPLSQRANAQRVWLTGVSNVFGFGLIALFVLYVKGIK